MSTLDSRFAAAFLSAVINKTIPVKSGKPAEFTPEQWACIRKALEIHGHDEASIAQIVANFRQNNVAGSMWDITSTILVYRDFNNFYEEIPTREFVAILEEMGVTSELCAYPYERCLRVGIPDKIRVMHLAEWTSVMLIATGTHSAYEENLAKWATQHADRITTNARAWQKRIAAYKDTKAGNVAQNTV